MFCRNGAHKWELYASVAEGGVKAASGLWMEGRLCSMLTVMLDRDCRLGLGVGAGLESGLEAG